MRQTISTLVLILGLLLVGIVAGMAFSEVFIVYPTIKSLGASDAILFYQSWFPFLGGVTRMFVLSSVIVCLLAIIFFSSGRTRWLLIASLVCYAVMLGFVFTLGAPTGQSILQLDPSSPPQEWKEIIGRASTVSALRTTCAGLAFLLQITAFGVRPHS
jgi:hypothetical protein